jgi:hypothetical protein
MLFLMKTFLLVGPLIGTILPQNVLLFGQYSSNVCAIFWVTKLRPGPSLSLPVTASGCLFGEVPIVWIIAERDLHIDEAAMQK